jgi:hypothetical protein
MTKLKLFFVLALSLMSCNLLAADEEPTAFQLMKEGNRYIGEQAKDKVIEAHSDKSIGTLTPKVWHITYFDPTASLKSVEVKFAAGKMVDVKRPFRLIQQIGDGNKALDRDKLKIDSDKAIEIALKEPILENIKVKSVELHLESSDSGPIWKVKMWAAKLDHPNSTVNIGEITVTADDGKVIETDVHIDRVD